VPNVFGAEQGVFEEKNVIFLLFSVIFRKNGRCTTVAKEYFGGVIGKPKARPSKTAFNAGMENLAQKRNAKPQHVQT
jgi:hypothetical protein